jgi:beta-glucosidase
VQLSKEDFGDDFKWGTSTAAYQVEGAYNIDGKGPSVWDVFTTVKGKIHGGDTGNIACDFYHKYAQDISLMSQLNIPNFRFSISWSRIIPYGTGSVNLKGIEFYNKVINFCLDIGIVPWITIYHWDLPYELEKKGGWTNRNIINWFSDYVAICIKHFGDRVKHWIVLNEPMAFTGAGYFLGVHAPGRKGLSNFLAAVHHAAICQAEGGRIIKSLLPDAKVGTTLSCSLIQPFSPTEKNIIAATRMDALLNRLFVEPLAGLGYPVKDLKFLQRLEPYIKGGDEKSLAFNMDFIGIQNYTREIVQHCWYTPFIKAKLIKANKRNVQTTAMDWEIYPECIYEMLKKFSKYSFKEIVVTENGAAFPDKLSNNEVNDEQRKSYLQQHIQQVLRAKQEGINVTGYFVWSFTDNFEWAEGYSPRFGLIYVDFLSQKRTIKSSGYWYKEFLQNKKVIAKLTSPKNVNDIFYF